YNASKHGVVTVSETLFHELRAANAKVSVSVLCPAYVPTNIASSERNRPADLVDGAPLTRSQIAARERSEKAVSSGRMSAAEVALEQIGRQLEPRPAAADHERLRSVARIERRRDGVHIAAPIAQAQAEPVLLVVAQRFLETSPRQRPVLGPACLELLEDRLA